MIPAANYFRANIIIGRVARGARSGWLPRWITFSLCRIQLVTHKRKFLGIRRPRIYVNRPLAPENIREYPNLGSFQLRARQRHHAKLDVRLRVMPLGAFGKGEK